MEGPREQLHPLQNPLILEQIFKGFNAKELKLCRLVCRAWFQSSRKAMRASARVTLAESTLPKFAKLVDSKLSKFSRSPFATTFKIMYGNPECADFWKFCGNHIKSLKFYGVYFNSEHAFKMAIFQSCPNLQELEFDGLQICEKDSTEDTEEENIEYSQNQNVKILKISCFIELGRISLMEFLKHFPFVEDLTLTSKTRLYDQFFASILALRTHDRNVWNLTKLELSMAFVDNPENIVPALTQFGASLVDMIVTQIGRPEDIIALRKIIGGHATTLKKLTLKAEEHFDANIFPFPNYEILEKLQEFSMHLIYSSSFNQLGFIPNVGKVNICVNITPEVDSVGFFVLKNCTELTLRTEKYFKSDDIRKLSVLVPNLEILMIWMVTGSVFSLICEFWQNLKSLDMESSALGDADLTGFDSTDVYKINRDRRIRCWRPITVQRANISSLRRLENLNIDLHPCRYPLTYCTAKWGIQQIPCLKNMSISTVYTEGSTWNRLHEKFPCKPHQWQ